MSGPEPRVICILGTPRSGTSLTTRLLNIGGLYIGDESELAPPGSGNPTGFWEVERLMSVNLRVMGALRAGGTGRLSPGWERSPQVAAEVERARALVAEIFGGRDAWCWKDARNSLTLPFWRQVAPPSSHVICLRNPIDVASSDVRFAAERFGVEIDPDTGYALWERHIAHAIANTAGRPRIFVAYERYFDDWRGAVDRLLRFTGLGSPLGTPLEEEIRRFLEDGLCHHLTPAAEALADPALPDGVRSLYRALQPHLDGHVDPDSSAGDDELNALARQIAAARR